MTASDNTPLILGVKQKPPVLLVVVGCAKKDNSADTDSASRDLTTAQAAVSDKHREVVTNENDVEHRKREVLAEQQALADKEQALAGNREQLGSAGDTLVKAHAAYDAAVTSRLAKLDAALAGLATRKDAASIDALAGLHARRDLLAAKLASPSNTKDEDWSRYVKDVDTTFDAIERDLHAAAD